MEQKRDREAVLDEVLDGGELKEALSSLPPEATAGVEGLLRHLAHSTDAWDALGRWRMDARTEAYRRAYKLRGEGRLA